MLFTIVVSILASVVANVHCEKNVVDLSKRTEIVYLIPVSEAIYLNADGSSDNEIDSDDTKLLPLPRLILALAPAVEDEKAFVTEDSIKTGEVAETSPTGPEARSKRSPGGGGCNKCGYRPSGGSGGGGDQGVSGGSGKGSGGGGGGSWSQSSASASSGGWGGGGGKYHGRK